MGDVGTVRDFSVKVQAEPIGEPEAHVSQCIVEMMAQLGIAVASQAREETHPIIPDFAIIRDGNVTAGYIEVKQPAVDIAPDSWRATTHNGRQWRYLRQLNNVFYTNGLDWVLYQRGVESGRWRADSDSAGLLAALHSVVNSGLEPVVTADRFLNLTVPVALELSRAIEKLALSEDMGKSRPRLGAMWAALRSAGFSSAGDDVIADVVVQTYVFALIVAAHDYGLDVSDDDGSAYRDIIANSDELLGAVLGLVDGAVNDGADSVVAPLVRQLQSIVVATDWPEVEGRAGKLLSRYLFEDFLELFSKESRESTGSYYTPQRLVHGMVNLVAEVSEAYGKGLANSVVVDPAVGTGTFPLEMVDYVARESGATGGELAHVVGKFTGNIHGWEMQVTPYAIAASTMRAKAEEYGTESKAHFMIRDSLRNPQQIISDEVLSLLAADENRYTLGQLALAEDEFCAHDNVDIIGGNPPYDATKLEVVAPWAYERMAQWRKAAKGQGWQTTSNLYTAFIRAMCWQAWEKPDAEDSGIVYFVAPSSWLRDKGGAGIRAWIREQASRVWVVDITPEGWMSPGNPFPISTPVAVVIMQRDSGKRKGKKAVVKYRSVAKNSMVDQRLDELCGMSIYDDGWVVATGDEFIPVAKEWLENPAVSDVFLAINVGSVWSRKWAVAPSEKVLRRRIDVLNNLPDEDKPGAFTDVGGVGFSDTRELPHHEVLKDVFSNGRPLSEFDSVPYLNVAQVCAIPMVGLTAITDYRVVHRPFFNLWGGRLQSNNLFVCTANTIKQGASVHTTDLVPQHFVLPGGERVHPTYQPDGRENTAPGLVEALSALYGVGVAPNDVAAYITAVTAFSGYQERFEEELSVPTIRVPFTSDPTLWGRAVDIGQRIIALSTADRTRVATNVPKLSGCASAVEWLEVHNGDAIGERASHWLKLQDNNGVKNKLVVGGNVFTGVTQDILNYRIGNAQIVKKWLERRLSTPYGKSMSPLDKIMPDEWEPEWSVELFKLLQTIEALIAIEGEQRILLEDVVAGELLTMQQLEKAGATWPGDIKDPLRKAHWPDEEQDAGGLFD